MSLVDKIASDAEGNIRLAAHFFSAGVFFFALGEITRQQLIDGLGLEASDEPQLDQLATYYAGLSVGDKREFFGRVESSCILLQSDFITKIKFKAMLGMS